MAVQRYVMAQCPEEGKGETGLDEYEVWRWDSVAVKSTAAAPADGEKGGLEPLLAKLSVPEVERLLAVALPLQGAHSRHPTG